MPRDDTHEHPPDSDDEIEADGHSHRDDIGSTLYPHDHIPGEEHDHTPGESNGHSHGPSYDEPTPDDWWGRWKRILLEWYHGLAHSMFEAHAFENIEKEAEDIEDAFLFACFADAFGIPSPVSYYTVELLPYLTEEFEQWERRMWDRDTLLERKGEQYHFH